MPSRTLWLWTFLALLGLTTVLGVLGVMLPGIPFDEELFGTSILLTAFSLLGLLASIAISRQRLAGLAWVSLGFLVVGVLLWLFAIWASDILHWKTVDFIAKIGSYFTSPGIVALLAALLGQLRLDRQLGRLVRIVTIVASIATGLLVAVMLWDDSLFYNEWVGRTFGASLIITALGTIAVPVLARIEFVSRRDGDDPSLGRHVEVWMRCPRCSREGERTANRRELCEGCGLETTVTIIEPRCECGYLLHGLPEPICPECGRAVEESNWWRAAPHG